MDAKPYMEFTLADMDEALIPELRKLAKGKFDRDACLSAANELRECPAYTLLYQFFPKDTGKSKVK